ncbi:hypothetical protein SEA_PINKCOFFEE_76 [Gordonia phage PinkCoffee]|uniref:Uncharacterized protein n=1 Tax=Gordonia phage Danyall TaxID=2250390 RepID=A0A345KRA1_9CAUD|nr:hypothetical protein KNT95_gp75 [Gordonia phage Danyall]AXH45553.1 hypothetical protein SEA_DANYALL_75 [Gordonia phage Danyall]QZD98823.1 hypothetical protein SEA_PINKCOFFEE_76 [Gordonia phage PinkCoffee]
MGSFLFALFFVMGTGIPLGLFILMGTGQPPVDYPQKPEPHRLPNFQMCGRTIHAFDGGAEIIENVCPPDCRACGRSR